MPDTLQPDLVLAVEDGLTRSVRFFRRILKEEANARDLTQAQYNALRQMLADGEQRMSELAHQLELTNGAATGLVERLEARGLVVRTVAPDDARGVMVRVTPEGERVVDEVLAAIKVAIARALTSLSVAERHMAVGGIQALAEALGA